MCIFSNVRPQKAKIKISPFPHCRPSITYTVKIRKRKDKKFVFPVYSLVHKVPYHSSASFPDPTLFSTFFLFLGPTVTVLILFPFLSLTHSHTWREKEEKCICFLVGGAAVVVVALKLYAFPCMTFSCLNPRRMYILSNQLSSSSHALRNAIHQLLKKKIQIPDTHRQTIRENPGRISFFTNFFISSYFFSLSKKKKVRQYEERAVDKKG